MLRKFTRGAINYGLSASSGQAWRHVDVLRAQLALHSCRKRTVTGALSSNRWLSSSANPGRIDSGDPVQTEKKKRYATIVSTLDPSKYTVQDIFDISGLHQKGMWFVGFPKADRFTAQYKRYAGKSRPIPFPPNSKGVFYFHDRTSVHPLAGDIRFRVLPVDGVQDWNAVDKADLFARGHDLVEHAGLEPWGGVSLISIMRRRDSALFRSMKAQGLISEETEEQAHRLFSRPTGGGTHGILQNVEKITDPFPLELRKGCRLLFLQKECAAPWRFTPRFYTSMFQRAHPHFSLAPYSGTILARFEALTTRGLDNQPVTKVALRVLKFIRPPEPGDEVVQEEGQLLKRYDPRDKVEEPWIGKPRRFMTPSSLALLEETYLPPTSRSGS